jgi:hypothetical protein
VKRLAELDQRPPPGRVFGADRLVEIADDQQDLRRRDQQRDRQAENGAADRPPALRRGGHRDDLAEAKNGQGHDRPRRMREELDTCQRKRHP